MAFPGQSAPFNDPPTDDTTSAPPEPVPQPQNPVMQNLQKRKKGFGPNVKNPGALAGAIARAKKARQGNDKWGN